MTYCVGMKVKDGLVAIADTRITSGTETTIAKKYYSYIKDKQAIFLMTAGLRSVRDKALTYFRETIEEDNGYGRLYEAANALGKQIKRVAKEDGDSLKESGLHFNLHTIIGGQFEKDQEPKLFMIYPEGNWIEVGEGSPFIIIGNSGFGKPILRRTISKESTLKEALKTGFLSFDSTRVSANDVDFPIDVIIYKNNSFDMTIHRYEMPDLYDISKMWGNKLKEAINEIPDDWMSSIL